MAKNKNKASKKNLEHDHNIFSEQHNDLVGNKGSINSLIDNSTIYYNFHIIFQLVDFFFKTIIIED